MRKLTERQQLFCNYFIKSGNATKSAIRAGYSKRSSRQIANRLMAKVQIQSYIHQKMKQIKSHAIASASEIMEYYTKVLRGEVTDDVAIGTPDGVYTGTKRPDVSERNQAAKELMKRYAPIEKAKTKKLNAEANMKNLEFKRNNVNDNRVIDNSNKLLDKMEEYGKRDYQKENN